MGVQCNRVTRVGQLLHLLAIDTQHAHAGVQLQLLSAQLARLDRRHVHAAQAKLRVREILQRLGRVGGASENGSDPN